MERCYSRIGRFIAICLILQISLFSEEKEKIIFIGTSFVIAKYIGGAVKDLGYEPVFLININDFSSQIADVIEESEWYDVNINSFAAIDEFLENNWQKIGTIAGITSLSDSKLQFAEQLAEKWNVPGPDQAVKLLADKNQVYRLIPQYSPGTFNFFVNSIPLSLIHAMIDQYGAVVIKPAKGSGALGTIILKEKISSTEIYALLNESGMKNINRVEWIAQAYIDGTLYSLEGYCLEGKPTFLGLTRRSRIAMTEMANHFPSDQDLLIQKNSSMLYGGIRALIERSGFKKGYFHCEFLVNAMGAYLIDANFGRIGGAAMIEQFAHSFEITPQEMTKHVIDVCLFGGKHLPSYTYKSNPRPSLCLCYGVSEGGCIKKVHLSEEMSSFHTIVIKDQAAVPPIGNSDYSWIGILSGEPERVLEEVKQIRIQTDKGIVPAYYFID